MTLYKYDYCLALTLLILQIWDISSNDSDYVIVVPRDVTAQEGLCVHIPCSFTVPSDLPVTLSAFGLWYRPKPHRELVASNKEEPRGRMFFTGMIQNGDCSLFINDVQKRDQSTYQFRLEDYANKNFYSYKTLPYLVVTELTDKPEIFVEKMIAGQKTTTTCRSPGTCAGSPPVIQWNGKDGDTWNFQSTYSNNTSRYFSNFTFTPTKDDNQSPLTCEVAFLQNTAAIKQTITLNVEYPPEVIISVAESPPSSSPPQAGPPHSPGSDTENTSIVKEGDNTVMTCMVDSNPTAEITLYKEDKVIKEPVNGRELPYSLGKASVMDAGRYLCMGRNEHGTSNKTIKIIVHYPPRTPLITCTPSKDCTLEGPTTLYILENSTVSILCSAEGLPEASMSWERYYYKTTGVKGLLTFHNVSLKNEGKFTCVAKNSYGESRSVVNIRVTYKPRTVIGRDSRCWEHRGLIACTCIIQSFPTAFIQWNIDEKFYPSKHTDQELDIFTATINAQTNSTLTFKAKADIHTIWCKSSNKHGDLPLLLYDGAHFGLSSSIIVAICCVVVIVLLIIGGSIGVHYLRKKMSSRKAEDKKEINTDGSVIYTNSEGHFYGNGEAETGTVSGESVPDIDTSLYMNVEDVQYVTINFIKMKPKDVPENIEIEYAEIKK